MQETSQRILPRYKVLEQTKKQQLWTVVPRDTQVGAGKKSKRSAKPADALGSAVT